MSSINLVSETLVVTPAQGQIEYDGNYWATDSSGQRKLIAGQKLLQTIDTTSGTSFVVSGLDLKPYKEVKILWNAVSTNASTQTLTINGMTATPVFTSAGQGMYGVTIIDLVNGYFRSFCFQASLTVSEVSQNPTIYVGKLLVTNTATGFTIAHAGGATFDNGSIEIYGVA